MRKLILFGVVFFLVAGGLLGFALYNLNGLVNQNKDQLLAQAEHALGRKVQVGKIGFTFWGGIGARLQNFALADDPAFSLDNFIQATDLQVNLKLMPLLNQEISVKRVILHDPVIRVIRNAKGVFNFASLFGARLKNFALADDPAFSANKFIRAAELQTNLRPMLLLNQEISVKRITLHDPAIRAIGESPDVFSFAGPYTGVTPGTSPGASDAAASSSAGPLPFLVALLDITNGDIHYTDHRENTELRINQLDLKVEDLSLDKPLSLTLLAAVVSDQQNFQLAGTFGPLGKELQMETLPINGSIRLDPLDIVGMQKAFPRVAETLPTGLGISGPMRISSRLSGTAGALTLSDIQLTASIFGSSEANVKMTGDVGPVGTDIHALALKTDIAFGPVSMPQLLAFSAIAENLPTELNVDGRAFFDAHMEGDLKNLAISATVEATDSGIQFADQFLKPRNTRMTLSTDARITPEMVALQQAKIQLHTLELTSSGNLTLGSTVGVDLQLDSNAVELTDWQHILPQLEKFSPTGQMELHTHVEGVVGTERVPDITGTFVLHQVSASVARLPKSLTDLKANITFTGQGAEIKNASARIGQSDFQLAATVARFLPLDVTYTFTSPELWLADVQASESKEAFLKTSSDVLKTLKSEGKARMVNEQLAFTGTVSSAQGQLANVEYTDFQTTLSLLNEVAKIESLSLQTLGGLINATGEYNMFLARPQFHITSHFADIELGEVFRTQISNPLQVIRGNANFELDLVGSGEDWEGIKPTLRGEGKLEVDRGTLVDLNIADEALANISGIPGLKSIVSQNLREKYPAIFAGKDTEFAEFGSQFAFDKGKILLNDAHFNAVYYTAQGDGWLDYDQQIDFNGQVTLAENLSKDILDVVKLARYMSNEEGRIIFPFALSGTLSEVKPLPDIAALSNQVRQGVAQKSIEAVQEKVLDKILPSTSLLGLGRKPDQVGQANQESEADVLEDSESSPPPAKPEDVLKEGLRRLLGK